jgi:signal peptidase I
MNGIGNVSTTLACGLAGEVVRTFGEVRLRVFGTSMVPSILPGDVIFVRHAGLFEMSPGEIVLYSREGRLFAHRVVTRAGSPERPFLITRGDRLYHTDPPVSSSELLGRVNFIERRQKRFRPATGLSIWRRKIVLLLRSSDRVTYLYLRLAAGWPSIFSRWAACRA